MLALAALCDAALDALPADVLPLQAVLSWLPRQASDATAPYAMPLGDALLGAQPHEHGPACANGDSGGDGQIPAGPHETALSGMQVPVSMAM